MDKYNTCAEHTDVCAGTNVGYTYTGTHDFKYLVYLFFIIYYFSFIIVSPAFSGSLERLCKLQRAFM